MRLQLEAVVAERDGLREDLRGFRDSKRQSDQSWRSERQRVEALESELAFYQTQSAGAMAERDKVAVLQCLPAARCYGLAAASGAMLQLADCNLEYVVQASWEAEELRAANLRLEDGLSKSASRAETLQDTLSELKHQFQAAQKRNGKLEALAKECEAIPGLRKELAAATHRADQLLRERDALQVCAFTEDMDAPCAQKGHTAL